MSIFDIISLLGGLAMFLYGMRLMGDSLKEGSSGTLKNIMEKVTNNPIKAFLLGLLVTAIIQSSTATIVLSAGLVAAGVISLHQSLGIIIGANVGTTVTGQIIRLLDVGDSSTSFLNLFKPSTLAPLALIAGVILFMFLKSGKSDNIGKILIGFGILFSGLINMTNAVSALSDSGYLDTAFTLIGDKVWLGYLIGAGVSFILQSSSASVGILQAFALASAIPFKATYAIIVGIFLGDCLTTGIVCSIGAAADSKRVGLVNILFNLAKSAMVLIGVNILHVAGALNSLWDMNMTSGTIANTNTIFNIICAIVLLPVVGIFEKLSYKMIKDDKTAVTPYDEKLSGLNPSFLITPAIALNSCYEILDTTLTLSIKNIGKALNCLDQFDPEIIAEIERDEDSIDMLTDKVGQYLGDISPYASEEIHIQILNQYNKMVHEFERLGDHAMNIAEIAVKKNENKMDFSESALEEIKVTRTAIDSILEYTRLAFEKRDIESAHHIEPMEEVFDDMIALLTDNHMNRLRRGICSINAGIMIMDIFSNLERISDICSNVGIATIARVDSEAAQLAHTYVSKLHNGKDSEFLKEYNEYHEKYIGMLQQISE